MRIAGKRTVVYLYLNGLEVSRSVKIDEFVELLPASCSPRLEDIIAVSQNELDLGIVTIFLPRVHSQFRIIADNPQKLAIRAWNTVWDAVLLSALFDCNAVCNLQCDGPAENFSAESDLLVTNYHLRGLVADTYTLNDDELSWVENNFLKARRLLGIPEFRNAVHSLATYRWHSLPRAQLALIWSGIEGLFKIHNEIVFRLSLYIARFLSPTDENERKQIFSQVKKLYKYRSAAVHGSKADNALSEYVDQSVSLLRCLVYKCIEIEGLPQPENLVP